MTDVDSVKIAANRNVAVVIGDKTEYAYSDSNYFNTDQALGVTPTLYVALSTDLGGKVDIDQFELTGVRYYMDVNGGSHTYRLYLLEAASADNVQNASDVLFDSGAAQAEATAYEWGIGGKGAQGAVTTAEHQLPKIVKLSVGNRLYYQIDWSTAPSSSVQGYIKIRGRLLK